MWTDSLRITHCNNNQPSLKDAKQSIMENYYWVFGLIYRLISAFKQLYKFPGFQNSKMLDVTSDNRIAHNQCLGYIYKIPFHSYTSEDGIVFDFGFICLRS